MNATEELDARQKVRFRAMFDAHYDMVFRVLRRYGLDADTAEDGAQQVYLVAMRRIEDIEVGKERPFLAATAVRIAARLRVRERGDRDGEIAEESRDPGPSPEALTDQKRQRELLDRILFEMDADLRSALVLGDVEGFGKRELADALAIPEGTAASRLRRAREDFKARLSRHLARTR